MLSQKPRAASLWLPLRRPGLAWTAALLTTLLYGLGMSRDLTFFDSGELALAAVQLGLSHPPGQPLYTLLGFLFSAATPGAPLLGLSFLSALAGGLTLLPVLSIAEQMLDDVPPKVGAAAWLLPVSLVAGSQHAALWEQATRVEVYALAVCLCLWAAARGAHLLQVGSSKRSSWLWLGLVLGLAAAVNPVLALFVIIAALPALVVALRKDALGGAQLAWLTLGGLAGLVPYAYVPLVAGRSDVLVWGAPTSFDALLDYLSGHDFRSNLSVSGQLWAEQVFRWIGFSYDSALLPVWGMGLVAHGLYPARGLTRAFAAILCVLSVLYLARYVIFVPAVPDYVSYVSLASWLCLAGCSVLLVRLWERGLPVAALALLGALGATVLLAQPGLLARSRSRDHTARAIVSALLESAPRSAIVIAGSDHWLAPAWYLQEVERKRPDVIVLASGLLSSSWYFEHVYQLHPDLAQAPLRGPGGQLGRLARLLAANPARPLLFEDPDLAVALGMRPCVHRFFAAARTPCEIAPDELAQAAKAWTALLADASGEPTSLGVLASISYQRGLLLVRSGSLSAALQTLLVPTGLATDLTLAQPGLPLRVAPPEWQRRVPLGDPARNLYVAAQVALASGATKQGLAWMLAARDLGLPEAETWLTAMAARAAEKGAP